METPRRREIQIDRASLLELARGTNLYHEPFAFIRELLQNAADATLVRLFEERGASAFPTHEGSLRELRLGLEHRGTEVGVDVAELRVDLGLPNHDADRTS